MEEKLWPTWCIKKQGHYFADKDLSSQGYDFFSSYVWMWEMDYKESWVPKNWCFWTMVFEKTVESPLDFKIKPVNPKGNQSWIFIGRTDAEAETPILWPPDAKNWLIGKDPDAGKDWRLEEKGTTEDEMVGWHHQLDGHEFEWTPVVGDGWDAWCAVVHGVTKSQTQLGNWTEWLFELHGVPFSILHLRPQPLAPWNLCLPKKTCLRSDVVAGAGTVTHLALRPQTYCWNSGNHHPLSKEAACEELAKTLSI